MKALAILTCLGVLAGACSSGSVEPPPSSVISNPTTSTTTALEPPAAVTLRLSDVEARAATGAAVQVSWADGNTGFAVTLTGQESQLVAIPADGETVLDVWYLVEGGRSEPHWTQAISCCPTSVVIEQPWRREAPDADPIVMAWQSAGGTASYLEQLEAAPGLTVTSPQWWSIDGEGLLSGSTDAAFVTRAQAHGLQVWPYIENGFDPIRTRRLLADETRRQLLVVELATQAMEAGADGVNVDFESFAFVDRDSFTSFTSELAEAIHAWGGVVSVDITVRTDTFRTVAETLAPIYDRRALAEAADFVVLMAYDEHTTVRPAGPTASATWVDAGINYLLRYADPHEILLGIPFYSRIWDPDNLREPRAVGIGTVAELAAVNPRTVDAEHGVDRVSLPDGRFLWAEDYTHLAERMDLATEAGVAGVAAWRLGLDGAEVWPIVAPTP